MLLVSLLNLETLSFDNRSCFFLFSSYQSSITPKKKKGRGRKNIPRESCSISPPGSFISEQAKPSFHLNRDVMNDAHFCNSLGANYSLFSSIFFALKLSTVSFFYGSRVVILLAGIRSVFNSRFSNEIRKRNFKD